MSNQDSDFEEPIDLNDNNKEISSSQNPQQQDNKYSSNILEAPLSESDLKDNRLTNAARYSLLEQPLYRDSTLISNPPPSNSIPHSQQPIPNPTTSMTISKTSFLQKSQDSTTQPTSHSLQFRFKIILVGDIAVGKTSFVNRYISNTFSNEYKSTIGAESIRKLIQYDTNTKVELVIWDTAGEERYRSMQKSYFKDAHGAIVVFDLTNNESFAKITQWTDFIKENSPANIVINLVGNKSDKIKERVINYNTLKLFAEEIGVNYFEGSAFDGSNVAMVFENLTEKMVIANKDKVEKDDDDEEDIKKTKVLNLKQPKKKNKRKCC